MHIKSVALDAEQDPPTPTTAERDLVRAMAEKLPRPVRFLTVGGLGLLTDIGIFTLIQLFVVDPLLARLLSLAVATLVTWRLNRAVTFDDSGRAQDREAMRYVAVTAAAQGTSYAVFAVLALTIFAAVPQIAIVVGAAAGALISYNGHRLFAFAPTKPATLVPERSGRFQ